ncbi:hypothetical protein IAE22_35015, partial [Bacillus sp. S34]|nr:hypothetical protein [Bacillus sp. S34]
SYENGTSLESGLAAWQKALAKYGKDQAILYTLGVLGDADLAMLLGRLGITTLGEFAALGDDEGVLELCGPRLVPRGDGPVVGPD